MNSFGHSHRRDHPTQIRIRRQVRKRIAPPRTRVHRRDRTLIPTHHRRGHLRDQADYHQSQGVYVF